MLHLYSILRGKFETNLIASGDTGLLDSRRGDVLHLSGRALSFTLTLSSFVIVKSDWFVDDVKIVEDMMMGPRPSTFKVLMLLASPP